MNLEDLEKVLDQGGKDKGIDKNLLIGAIEEALLTVARRQYGARKEIEAKYNPDVGEVELYEFKTVVETVSDKDKEISQAEAHKMDPDVTLGDSVGIKIDASYLSRIAAQTAKQVLLQKVRDAEREIIFNEFRHRKGEVITGLIRRVDKGAVIVDLGRTEGYMPLKEQIPEEPYNSGERIQAYLMDVQLTPKGPRIILSRACPEYLISLFENEVPEIREGLVEIVGVKTLISYYFTPTSAGFRAMNAGEFRMSSINFLSPCLNRSKGLARRPERPKLISWPSSCSTWMSLSLRRRLPRAQWESRWMNFTPQRSFRASFKSFARSFEPS